MSDLQGWSDIIRRQGEQAREREEEQTQRMLEELPAVLTSIGSMEDQELLTHLNSWVHSSQSYYSKPRKQSAMFRLLSQRCRREILKRMQPS